MHRSLLFVPGDQERHLRKARDLPADAVVFELEDGVPAARKGVARKNIAEALRAGGWRQSTYIRLNPIGSPQYVEDCALLEAVAVDGVVLPKVEAPALVAKGLAGLEGGAPRFRVIALIESFRAMESLHELSRIPGVFGLGLGLEDLFSDSLLNTAAPGTMAAWVRCRVVAGAKAAGLYCFDSVSLEVGGTALEYECGSARTLGFDGKFGVHPDQVAVINRAFSPTPDERSWACRVLEKVGPAVEVGYRLVDGEFITPPKIRKARHIMSLCERYGEI